MLNTCGFYVLPICLLIAGTNLAGGLLYNDVYWTTAIQLSDYEGYRSVSLLSYEVPSQADKAVFTFMAKTSGSSCEFREVNVYFQHGSYPLVTPYNETFPPNFYLNRTDAFNVKIQQDADAVSYMLPNPKPGIWYFAAFLPKATDEIKQKGLSKSSCQYGMVVVVEARGADYIQDIPTHKTQRVHLQQSDQASAIYRYMLPKDTVQYGVKINSCVSTFYPPSQSEDAADTSTNPSSDNSTNSVSNSTDATDSNSTSSSFTNIPTPAVTYSILSSTKSTTQLSSDNSTNSTTPPSVNNNSTTPPSVDNNSTTPPSVDNNFTTPPSIDNNSTSPPSLDDDSTTQPSETTKTTTPPSNTSTTTGAPSTLAPVISDNCPVKVYIQSSSLPTQRSVELDNCGNKTHCRRDIMSPNVEDWTYITVEIDNSYNVSEVAFDLKFDLLSCEPLEFLLPKMIVHRIQRDEGREYTGPNQDSCVKANSLGRFDWAKETFNVSYVLVNQMAIPSPTELDNIPVEDYSVMVTSFSVEEPVDLGGTLTIQGTLDLQSFDAVEQTAVVYVCVMHGALPGGQTVRPCTSGLGLALNVSDPHQKIYVPYPETGVWYMGLNSQCFNKNTSAEVKCKSLPHVDLRLFIGGCVDGGCGDYGQCVNYISGVHVFSSCKCFAGWQGYGCTDGRNSRSRGEELTAVLLLTLSNLFFIPSVALAVYRGYHVEAAIYFFTMFMSTFYHACDTSDLVYYCMFRYDILSFADFLGSICSFWVTMLVMSKLPQRVRGFAQTVGAVGIAVGVEYDRHGLLVFAIPAGLAFVTMLGSWIFQCGRHKRLYPTRRYLLLHLLPGVVLAVVGLVLFAFLETDDNYKYTHSCWHVAMSSSIVFLLPTRPSKASTSQDLTSVTVEGSDNGTDLETLTD